MKRQLKVWMAAAALLCGLSYGFAAPTVLTVVRTSMQSLEMRLEMSLVLEKVKPIYEETQIVDTKTGMKQAGLGLMPKVVSLK